MAFQQPSKRHCHSNHSHSFPNLHSSPLITFDFKQFYLKKSLFNPPLGLAESYAARRHIAAADVPIVEVIRSSTRWLLLQTPRPQRNFFALLHSGSLGNPYEMLLKTFKGFAALAKIFGYFRPTSGMIFMDGKASRVWMSEDVFSGTCDMPLGNDEWGEREFVVAFLAMVEGEMSEWERVGDIDRVEETVKLLDWRAKISKGRLSAIKASREVFQPRESKTSFEAHELGGFRKLNDCRSVRELGISQSSEFEKVELSSSTTIKEECRNSEKRSTPNLLSGLFSDLKDLKKSFNQAREARLELGQEASRAKKKFNLTSTSSTLQRFSEKWRSTVGKKGRRYQPCQPKTHEKCQSGVAQIKHQSAEQVSIQAEMEGLFGEEEAQLVEEGNREELQKIAEQIQQILIW